MPSSRWAPFVLHASRGCMSRAVAAINRIVSTNTFRARDPRKQRERRSPGRSENGNVPRFFASPRRARHEPPRVSVYKNSYIQGIGIIVESCVNQHSMQIARRSLLKFLCRRRHSPGGLQLFYQTKRGRGRRHRARAPGGGCSSHHSVGHTSSLIIDLTQHLNSMGTERYVFRVFAGEATRTLHKNR